MMDQSQRTPLIDYDVGMSDHYTARLHDGAIGDALGTAKTLLVGDRGHVETLAALAIYLAGINWLLHFLEDFRR